MSFTFKICQEANHARAFLAKIGDVKQLSDEDLSRVYASGQRFSDLLAQCLAREPTGRTTRLSTLRQNLTSTQLDIEKLMMKCTKERDTRDPNFVKLSSGNLLRNWKPHFRLEQGSDDDLRIFLEEIISDIPLPYYTTSDKDIPELIQSGILETLRQVQPEWSNFLQILHSLKDRNHQFACYYYVATLPPSDWAYLQCFTLGFQGMPVVVDRVRQILDRAPRPTKSIDVYRTILGSASESYKKENRQYPISACCTGAAAVCLGGCRNEVYKIHVRPGQKLLHIGPLSQYTIQQEVILDSFEDHENERFAFHELGDLIRSSDMFLDQIMEKLGHDHVEEEEEGEEILDDWPREKWEAARNRIEYPDDFY